MNGNLKCTVNRCESTIVNRNLTENDPARGEYVVPFEGKCVALNSPCGSLKDNRRPQIKFSLSLSGSIDVICQEFEEEQDIASIGIYANTNIKCEPGSSWSSTTGTCKKNMRFSLS